MKLKKILFIIICCLITPIFINASGGIKLSSTSGSVYTGSSTSFKISASNAAGKITISVEDGSIASINQSSVWLDNDSVTVSVKGIKVGSTKIKVYVNDMTTYDSEDVSGKTYIYSFTVKEKPNYSTNNKLKSISIEGYELQKKDDSNYYLIVNKNVESIKINAEAEDSKAKVSNTGNKDLNVGENKFEVIITSESGSENIINVIVTRKEGYSLDNLNEIIKDNNVQLILDDNTVISKKDIELIKNNKKIVTMDYIDENKNIIYSWIFDGNKINDLSEIKTSIKIDNENEKISKIINYATSLYIDFEHSGKIVDGTKININVSNYFNDSDNLNLYYYNENEQKAELVKKDIIVKDKIATIEIDHCSTYFLTKSTIIDMSKVDENGKILSNNKWLIIVGTIALLELIFICYKYIIKKDNGDAF